ncbi:MAG TPA: hypothetical protein VMI33_22855 [Streptosporangiaceae bacterium]|nr:hypothetical protein [Streptosporangiaceae bacterium]
MDTTDDVAGIAGEFPGWEAWQGIDRMWHARIRGATPPVMVHGEDLVDLRDQIIRVVHHRETGPGRRPG